MMGSIADDTKTLGQRWEEQGRCFAIVLVEKLGVRVDVASPGTHGAL